MYTIVLHFKPLQKYTDTIGLHFKTKSSVYILNLKHQKHGIFSIISIVVDIFEN